MNTMAHAWRKGADELGFAFVSPFSFAGADGNTYTATGYLPHFGGEKGTLIVSRFDDHAVDEAGDRQVTTARDSPRTFTRNIIGRGSSKPSAIGVGGDRRIRCPVGSPEE
jgi:hypothetical protein